MRVEEVAELFAVISDAFPGRLKSSESMLRLWHSMLLDVEAREATVAVLGYLADGPSYPPSISDIRRRVADERVPSSDIATAWEEVRKALAREGRYRNPQWPSPIVAGAVETIGWLSLCDTLDEDLPTVRAQFERYLKARVETAHKAENFGSLKETLQKAGMLTDGSALSKLLGGKK